MALDRRKQTELRCAFESYELLRKYSVGPFEQGAHERIASLMFEAATGERDADLSKACISVRMASIITEPRNG
jgi:hypothetical protein